jgi:uncharacterized protein (DUF302 family)
MADEGVVTRASDQPFAQTVERLESALREKNLTLFARIDHAAGAAAVHMDLRPTTLFIFGNPKGGTPLMQAAQQFGLELPLKVLVWEDVSGKTHLTYESPHTLAQRFGLDPALPAVASLSKTLEALVQS